MILVAILATLSVVCVNCSKDKDGPAIYFYASDGKTIDKKGDTTVLLYATYKDPGCYVEDNSTPNDKILVTDNVKTLLKLDDNGRVQAVPDNYRITYTATDESDNKTERVKVITCRNVSDVFAGKYKTGRVQSSGVPIATENFPGSTICAAVEGSNCYISSVNVGKDVPGQLEFTKVAKHKHYGGDDISTKIKAYMYFPDYNDGNWEKPFGYMKNSTNPDYVMYEGLTYNEAIDSILSLKSLDDDGNGCIYLKIHDFKKTGATWTTQNYEWEIVPDSLKYVIKGKDDLTGKPQSKIVYVDGEFNHIELALEIAPYKKIGGEWKPQAPIKDYKETYYRVGDDYKE